MATKVRIELNSEGFREILNSQAVADLCKEVGESIASKAGEGFAYFPTHLNYGGGRVGGFVRGTDDESMAAEATDKVLTKAVMQ